MKKTFYKLKQNVIAEPLVNRWYAWAYLVNPATYSLILTKSHLRILRSYIKAPHLHAQTSKFSQLAGGSFVNFDKEKDQISHVEKLIEDIEKNSQELFSLAEMLKEVNTIVQEHVEKHGPTSFFDVYKMLPEKIRGLIELVYDINNFPSFRIIESLLYKSSFYNETYQSVLFYQGRSDKRDFVLSTPRFPDGDGFCLNLPFSSSCYDEIFSSRVTPISGEALTEMYDKNIAAHGLEKDKFFSLFNSEGLAHSVDSKTKAIACSENLKITYVGHACVLLQAMGVSILLDPLIPYDMPSSTVERFSYTDLPETIDYAVITHSHKDHAVLETLLQLRHKIKTILVPDNVIGAVQDVSLKLFLEHCGFSNVRAMRELEEVSFLGGSIRAIPSFGEHADLNIQSKLSYSVTLGNKTMLFLSDSKNQEPFLYDRLARILPKIDCIFIGMECEGAPLSWLYGSLMMANVPRVVNHSRRLDGSNAEQGFKLVQSFKPTKVFVYAMAHEPWLSFIGNITYAEDSKQMKEARQFVNMCAHSGVEARILFGSENIH